jgi:murein DD-endopeptidase MepM/ murein hydrolase activator NlpD
MGTEAFNCSVVVANRVAETASAVVMVVWDNLVNRERYRLRPVTRLAWLILIVCCLGACGPNQALDGVALAPVVVHTAVIGTPTAAVPSTTRYLTWTPTQTGAIASPIPTWTPSVTPAVPTLVATRIATFTPPRLPADMRDGRDHYWFDRPIPADQVNWTDRIYPYGSTRGGLLPTHRGVEFINPEGVPVLAAGDGTVVTAGADDQVLFGPQPDYYGLLVVIRHEQLFHERRVYTLYGHLSQVLVTEGQVVASGDTVGLVGGTGVANGGAHLHFEIRIGHNGYEETRNPDLWLRPFPNRGTLAGRLLWADGSYVYGAPLLVQRLDDPTRFVNRTIYTYADTTVNPDDGWQENFAAPDVEAGPYLVTFRHSEWGQVLQEAVWVYPGETTLVTLQLRPLATPEPSGTPQ